MASLETAGGLSHLLDFTPEKKKSLALDDGLFRVTFFLQRSVK